MLEIFFSELIGVFFVVYFGCLGVFSGPDAENPQKTSSLQNGLVWGFVYSSVTTTIGYVTAAHLNPAITLCAFIIGYVTPFLAVVYFVAEILGALLATHALKLTVSPSLYAKYNSSTESCGFCCTCVQPGVTLTQAFVLEFVATALLVYFFCSIWDWRNMRLNDSTGLKFGLLMALLYITLAPFTGAGTNPARSLAPAIVNNVWKNHWIYWVAPLTGSAIATIFYIFVHLVLGTHEIKIADHNTIVMQSGTRERGEIAETKTSL